MHNNSFYTNISIGLALIPVAFSLITVFVFIYFGVLREIMESIVRLSFPAIFSEQLVVDQIEIPADENRIVTADAVRYKTETYFEGRIVAGDLKGTIYPRMFSLAVVLFGGVINIFLTVLLFEISYDCDFDEQFSKDCFLLDSPYSSPPLNCSSDVNATTEVICYRLAFHFNIAAGVAYGLFRLSTLMCHIGAVANIALAASRRWCFSKQWARLATRLFMVLLLYIPVIAVLLSEGRIGKKRIPYQDIIQIIYSCMTTLYFVVWMPWERIINESVDDGRNPHPSV